MPDWTREQEQAIYEKDSNILVAAAAGSGKTAVLVERIINKTVNEGVDINKLLVVTFTSAAASEMRERVLDAINEKLEKNADDINLQRQITLLNLSSICTIDSFCLEVVKNYFYELEGISANFRIADNSELDLLKMEVLNDLFEKKYLEDDEDFINLINIYTSYRDDQPLKDVIMNIYNYINSSPFPKKWLKEKVKMFDISQKMEQDFSQTPWGKLLLKEIEEDLIDSIAKLEELIQDMSYDKDLELFMQALQSDLKNLQILKENLVSWDKSYEIVSNLSFVSWPRKKVESDLKDEAKLIRDSIKKKIDTKIKKILITNSKQANEEILHMYLILQKLEKIILEYDDEFFKKKREKNIVDFTDIEHFALDILVKDIEVRIDENGNEYDHIVKTDVAKKYTEKFEEIAIDEYQDSNLVQEYILRSISRGNNIFMVGDVKQSIYKFRQAMPKLFLDKYKNYELILERGLPVTNTEEYQGRKIQLFKNFRSRDNVLDFTNLIFKNIMSLDLGDVDYDEKEYLNFGALDYKKTEQNLKTEINIINLKKEEQDEREQGESEQNESSQNEIGQNQISGLEGKTEESDDEEHIEDIEIEAKYVAQKIKELIDSKFQVYDRKSKTFRDVTYRDIAILLRSTKGKANIFEQEIMNLGMPVFADSNQEYLDSIEIQTIINLLKIIDNPIQDIPLVAVLKSPIANFSDDDLVQIRLVNRKENFYKTMIEAKLQVDAVLRVKIEEFFAKIEKWREIKDHLTLDEFIWKIYQDTNYYEIVKEMPNGELRQANLKMLFERAKKFEEASFKGLYNFINFVEKIKVNSSDLSAAKIIGEKDNVVRIMSIHKSKGLEFPIIFVSNTNKQFNEQDIRKSPLLLHQELGIGAKYINYEEQMQYDTLTRAAIKRAMRIENISEEMRILYVALTRAKEKIYITGTSKDLMKKLDTIEKQMLIYPKVDGKINYILLKQYTNYLDWILLVYLYEKSHSKDLLKFNFINPSQVLKNIGTENLKDLENSGNSENVEGVIGTGEGGRIINENEMQQELKNKTSSQENLKYQYEMATQMPVKMSVTKVKKMQNKKIAINKDDIEVNEIKFLKPDFMKEKDEKGALTAAEKGTLIHLCMQKLDFKEDYNYEKLEHLIDNMKKNNLIKEGERASINIEKILAFTKTEVFKELQKAKEIYKEKTFYMNINADEVFEEHIEEKILVEGIIDLFYIDENGEIVLLDYKTDRISAENEGEFIVRYKKQLELYKNALELTMNKKVKKVYIYSIYLEKVIEVPIFIGEKC